MLYVIEEHEGCKIFTRGHLAEWYVVKKICNAVMDGHHTGQVHVRRIFYPRGKYNYEHPGKDLVYEYTTTTSGSRQLIVAIENSGWTGTERVYSNIILQAHLGGFERADGTLC